MAELVYRAALEMRCPGNGTVSSNLTPSAGDMSREVRILPYLMGYTFCMAHAVLLEWEGKEYDHNPRSADWYWALGIVAVALALAAILFSSYLLALLIVIAAATLALHAAKEPTPHTFRLVEQGLMIGDDLHSFERMISFCTLEDIEGEFPPTLSIKTESWLSPHLVIPLEGVDVDRVYAHFLEHVDEREHPHSFHDLVAAWLGF